MNIIHVFRKRSAFLVSPFFSALVVFLMSVFIGAAPCHADEPAYAAQRILVRGSAIHGANGINFGHDGLLYVTSAVGSNISIIDPDSGRILRALGRAEGVIGPDDIAFSPDGTLYFTAFFTGQVCRMTPAGTAEVIANVGPGANAITFSDDGRLFVTRVFLGDALYEIDPKGTTPPRLIRSNLGGLNAMDFGPDGKLYGPLWFKGQVARVDVDSGSITTVYEGLHTAAAVKFDSSGRLHVIDQHEGVVLRIDLETGAAEVVARPGLGADNMAFDAEGRLFITNAHDGSVVTPLPNGAVRTVVPGGLAMPAGVAALTNPEGGVSVFAADTESLREFDGVSGKELSIEHASVGSLASVATPLTVSAFGNNLIVTSWFSRTVQLWDPWQRKIIVNYFDFLVPTNAIEFKGDIVVAELGSKSIVRRTPGTQDKETLLAGISAPVGLAAKSGSLWAGDWATGAIYQIFDNGVRLEQPRLVASGLKNPEGMAATDNSLIVAEVGARRLVKIDAATGKITELAVDLDFGLSAPPGYVPSMLMSGVAVDACGAIYVSLDRLSSIMRLTPTRTAAGVCKP